MNPRHWTPAAFCAVITLVPLWYQTPGNLAFYSFLPMCFVFLGFLTSQMHREIRDLRKQLVELQQKRGG